MPSFRYFIRNATENDAVAINNLCVAAYEEFREVIGSENWLRLREILECASALTKEGELIVAVDETPNVIGLVLYVPPAFTTNGSIRAASIRTLSVSPAHRGEGVGRRLTQECIARAYRDDAGYQPDHRRNDDGGEAHVRADGLRQGRRSRSQVRREACALWFETEAQPGAR